MLNIFAITVMVLLMVTFGAAAICAAYNHILEKEWQKIYKQREELREQYYAEQDKLADIYQTQLDAQWKERQAIERIEKYNQESINQHYIGIWKAMRHRARIESMWSGRDFHEILREKERNLKATMGYSRFDRVKFH